MIAVDSNVVPFGSARHGSKTWYLPSWLNRADTVQSGSTPSRNVPLGNVGGTAKRTKTFVSDIDGDGTSIQLSFSAWRRRATPGNYRISAYTVSALTGFVIHSCDPIFSDRKTFALCALLYSTLDFAHLDGPDSGQITPLPNFIQLAFYHWTYY